MVLPAPGPRPSTELPKVVLGEAMVVVVGYPRTPCNGRLGCCTVVYPRWRLSLASLVLMSPSSSP